VPATISLKIDATAPGSSINPMRPVTPRPSFSVGWSASDGAIGSGVLSVDVYSAADGGGFAAWQTGKPAAGSALFQGAYDHTYSFYSVATDVAGNVEQKTAADAATACRREFILPGDSTGDGTVNILDLIFIRDKLIGDLLSGDNWAADVNGDGKINVLDLIYTRNRIGTSLP